MRELGEYTRAWVGKNLSVSPRPGGVPETGPPHFKFANRKNSVIRGGRKVQRIVPSRLGHGFKEELVITIYPQEGSVGIRELGRPANTEIIIGLGEIYFRSVVNEVDRSIRRRG